MQNRKTKLCKKKVATISVVFFDQQKGTPHTVPWQKSPFYIFTSFLIKKKEEEEGACQKGENQHFKGDLSAFMWCS